MTNAEKLIAVGAQVVGGDLIWKHKVLGRFRNGEFIPTEEGLKALEIDDVVVKEDVKPAKPAAKTAPRKRAAAASEVVTEPAVEDAPSTDEPEIDLGDE
jgi:hypothetical protein